ncbi:hypothetical protein [Breoghania sp. JC706]|uniref:Bbp19 family protein n=1 Tax=Breoghania sp. JC706 TaxID=3117732 RepID=UPI00300817D9
MWASLKRRVRREPGLPRARLVRLRANELERAYRAVFDTPEGQIVLADLAAHARIYLAPSPELSEVQRAYADGSKALFARILACLTVTPEEHRELQEAARLELIDTL